MGVHNVHLLLLIKSAQVLGGCSVRGIKTERSKWPQVDQCSTWTWCLCDTGCPWLLSDCKENMFYCSFLYFYLYLLISLLHFYFFFLLLLVFKWVHQTLFLDSPQWKDLLFASKYAKQPLQLLRLFFGNTQLDVNFYSRFVVIFFPIVQHVFP